MPRAEAVRAGVYLPRPDRESSQEFGGRPPGAVAAPPIKNARLALVLFIATETMLFTALTGAFVVFRVASVAWPPPGQPYLPVGVTWVNTAFLVASSLFMRRAVRAIRGGDQTHLCGELLITAGLGSVFLSIQGLEWARLIRHGLTLSSSNYGATFYVLIGLHGLHVVGAVIWLAAVLAQSLRGRYSAANHGAVELCGLYWYFVCGLWVILFPLVYLI